MQPEMTMERAKNIARSTLLAFVLVSIGFALGKEVTARRQQNPAAGPEPSVPDDLRAALDDATDLAETWDDITPMAFLRIQDELDDEDISDDNSDDDERPAEADRKAQKAWRQNHMVQISKDLMRDGLNYGSGYGMVDEEGRMS